MLKTTIYKVICSCMAIMPGAMAVNAAETASASYAGTTDEQFVLVIDAGHGGKDTGCQGENANEKDITLDVAQRFCKLVDANESNVKTVLTRNDDHYLTLQQRADIANRVNGNLFVSIHVNSVDRKSKGRASVSGASVYVLGVDKEENTLNVAMRENSVIELEDDYSEAYRGFDPKSSESYIIFELNNNLHQAQSVHFADMIQQQLVHTAGRKDKGVRQAGFWVLWATSMPAVLVELDFICNPANEKFLDSEQGRQLCAEALNKAFSEYLLEYRRK